MKIAGIRLRSRHAVWLLLLAAFLSYTAIFLPSLPDAEGRGGPDYGYFVPQLLAGYFWYVQNGLWSLPWFTPAFCGGIPFFPNMQAMYLSVPQFLTFAAGPTLAIRLTFLLFAGAGLAGTYALLRHRFHASDWAAAAGAILFLFNGFFAFRMLAGHLTFHAFMLAPLVALAVLPGRKRDAGWRAWMDPWVIGAGFLVAYMVQSGMVHALPPVLAAIVVLILIHALVFGSGVAVPVLRLAAAGALALLLCAAKLAAAFAFLHEFPRTMLPLMGFESIGQGLVIAFKALFFAPPLVEETQWLRNNEWYPGVHVVMPLHEYAYTVTFVPLLVIAAALPGAVRLLRAAPGDPRLTRRLALIGAISAILAVPILLNWHSPGWTAFLKSLPVIANSSTLVRWFCLYIPVTVVATALILDRATPIRPFAAHAAIAALVVAVATDAVLARMYVGSTYYTERVYDFTRLERVYRMVRATGEVPAIERIDWADMSVKAPWSSQRSRNDRLATGGSQAMCYEPMFGHRLEEYPFGALKPGCVFKPGRDPLNLKNPACMLFPAANGCRPGAQFGRAEIDQARRFASYRPFAFEMPWYQHAANALSLGTFLILLAALAAVVVREYGRRRRLRDRG